MIGYDGYRLRSGLARKYRIGLNIVRTGEIGVKGLFLEYGEYSAEYSPTKGAENSVIEPKQFYDVK